MQHATQHFARHKCIFYVDQHEATFPQFSFSFLSFIFLVHLSLGVSPKSPPWFAIVAMAVVGLVMSLMGSLDHFIVPHCGLINLCSTWSCRVWCGSISCSSSSLKLWKFFATLSLCTDTSTSTDRHTDRETTLLWSGHMRREHKIRTRLENFYCWTEGSIFIFISIIFVWL